MGQRRGYQRVRDHRGVSGYSHSPEDFKKLLDTIPYTSFEDWGRRGEVIGGALNLARHHGLAHGENFRRWFKGAIGGKTFADARRDDAGPDKGHDAYRLRLIVTDTTQHKMLVLPPDLANYRSRAGLTPFIRTAF